MLVAMLGGGLLWATGDVGTRGVGGPFTLLDPAGRTVTDRAFRGRYMLVYFGYTTCPDICPTTLGSMAAALDMLGGRGARVQPVFVTVDPARDTPALLGAYAASIDPHLIALTGSDAAVAAAMRAYGVQRAMHPMPGRPGDYLIDHSSVLFLMAPDGRFRAALRTDRPPAQLAADLARLL